MNCKQLKLMAFYIMLAFAISSFGLLPLETKAESCPEMEEKGLLLYQQFKKGKVCKDSGIGEGWKECLFKAGDTEILLVSASRKSTSENMQGFHGSGFKVLSVGPDVRVRIFAGEDFGLLVRVEGKNNLEEKGCLYNKAYITLNSDVLSPGELNYFKYGQLHQSDRLREQIKYLQKNLVILGHRPGVIDGVFGPRTRAAFEAYKRDKHLQTNLPDEAIFNLIAEDAILKGLTELQKAREQMWEPKSHFR